MLAALEGRKSDEILERDDGLIYCGDPNDYFAPFRRWPPVERRAMRYVRGRVLDVGCGAGRISLHLQERGHEVLAIDESPLAVEVTRRRGVQHAEVRSLADVDASLGQFDSVLIVRNNFGLVGQEGRAVTVLRRLALITAEHGRIVTDSVDPERVEGRAFREYRTHRRNSVRPLAQRLRVRFERYTLAVVPLPDVHASRDGLSRRGVGLARSTRDRRRLTALRGRAREGHTRRSGAPVAPALISSSVIGQRSRG